MSEKKLLEKGPNDFTRLLQITLPQWANVLLSRLMLKRTEEGQPPSKVTKSALVADAIRKLAESEGLGPSGPGEGAP